MTILKLFEPLKLGSLTLPNRFIMAPLTRCRADLDTNVPNPLMAEYYGQRAKHAGLIISEFTSIDQNAITFHTEAGIANDDQVAGWKLVTQAVHENGGLIFCQIAHGGRAAHPLNNAPNPTYVAPSPIALTHTCNPEFNPTDDKQPYDTAPHELTDEEADAIVADFGKAAKRAMDAGFDGVEVHSANGYLIDQFLCETSNKRDYGKYAGTSLETRSNFLKEVLESVTTAVGDAGRVGMRLSPNNSYQDMHRGGKGPGEVEYLAKLANSFDLAYLHVMRADFFGVQADDVLTPARKAFTGTLITNMGYEVQEAEDGIVNSSFDAVAFGTKFIANPDLPARVKKHGADAPLNELKAEHFYTKGAEGYTDYPFMKDDEKKEEL